MAGFEIVVRPVVFPDIRPAPAQPLPPADDPDKGFVTIHGNGGHIFSVSSSYNASASSNTRSEVERREDEGRIFQKKDDGTINKKNFVDIRTPNRIKMKGPPERTVKQKPGPEGPMTGDDLTGYTYTPGNEIYYYRKMQEKDNIEIRRRNIITKKDGQESGGQ